MACAPWLLCNHILPLDISVLSSSCLRNLFPALPAASSCMSACVMFLVNIACGINFGDWSWCTSTGSMAERGRYMCPQV